MSHSRIAPNHNDVQNDPIMFTPINPRRKVMIQVGDNQTAFNAKHLHKALHNTKNYRTDGGSRAFPGAKFTKDIFKDIQMESVLRT